MQPFVAGVQIKGTIAFDRDTWLPKRLTMKVFGTCEERWHFNDWRKMKVSPRPRMAKPWSSCKHIPLTPAEVPDKQLELAGRVLSFQRLSNLAFCWPSLIPLTRSFGVAARPGVPAPC